MKNLLFIFTLFVASCSTMHFTKNNIKPTHYANESFHHIGIFRLVEFSDPVRPPYQCENRKWASVRTRASFLSGLVSGLTAPFYTPEAVSVSCKN